MDLLHRPHACVLSRSHSPTPINISNRLSPCGHILCLNCLQEWFRKAPPSAEDNDIDPDDLEHPSYYILTRPKSCPCCRAVVKRRPVPVFLVKSVLTVLTNSRHPEMNSPGGTSRRDRSPSPGEDPWMGLFRLTDDEREGDGANDDAEESDSDLELRGDAVRWALDDLRVGFMNRGPFGFGYDSSSPSGSDFEEEDDGDEDDEDDDPDEDDMDGPYVPQRWEPPSVTIDPIDYEGCFDYEEEPGMLNLLRRGCTYEMIQTYRMEYTHAQGLVARLRSLDELHVDADDYYSDEECHSVFLGWNIKLDEADAGGKMYMQVVLNDMKENQRGWRFVERVVGEGVFDVRKLVKIEEVEEYDTTDTEVWLDASHHYDL